VRSDSMTQTLPCLHPNPGWNGADATLSTSAQPVS